MVKRKSAVFLDRDGVLLRSDIIRGKAYAIRSIKEYELLPNVLKSLELLKLLDFCLVVITNQPDIGNGLCSEAVSTQIHERLIRETPIEHVYMCPHQQNSYCYCRKPAPGMIFKAQLELDLDLTSSWVVGDRASDVQSGFNAGCKSIFIDLQYKEKKPDIQNATSNNLEDAVKIIAKHCQKLPKFNS
ncbi:HAD-IIIA family hydrolase [Paracoccaceae bacterium]|nr:HAD-IIIA family hydrolase [Paracoccaceae bacterium]